MRSSALVCVIVLAAAPVSAEGPHIASTTPSQIAAGGSPHTVELEIDGSSLIPPGSTYQSIPVNVGAWVDDGSGWRQGEIVIPGNHGWGVGHLSIRTPAVVPTAPRMRIKLSVKGAESNVYTIPVFNIPPPAPPKITAVKPWETILGSSDYYFILQVHTNGQGGTLYFNGAQFTQYVASQPSATDFYFQFIVPKELRSAPGRYPIHVTNNKGDSPVVYWELVAPPTITSLAPAHLTAAQVAPGAKPVSVTATFGVSSPKTVYYTADANTQWTKAEPMIIFGHQVTFELDLAALHPKQHITIKLVNSAGEATKVLGITFALQPATTVPVIKK